MQEQNETNSCKNKMNKGTVESIGHGSKTMAAENSTNELKIVETTRMRLHLITVANIPTVVVCDSYRVKHNIEVLETFSNTSVWLGLV